MRRLIVTLLGLALAPHAEAAPFRRPVGVWYPPSVILAGLQTTWALHTTTGPNAPLTNTPVNNAAAITGPGGSITGSGATAKVNLKSGTYSNWDFSGYDVWVDGGQTITINNAKFAHAGGTDITFGIGVNAGIPTADAVTCNHCDFDATGWASTFEAPVKSYGALTETFSVHHDSPRDHIDSLGALALTDVYFKSPNKNGVDGSTAHAENIHFFAGTGALLRVLFDVRDCSGSVTGAGHIDGNWTAPGFFSQAFTGNLTVTADRVIVLGGAACLGSNGGGTNYTLQTKNQVSPAYTSATTLSNSLLESGTSSYNTNANGSTLTDGGGNRRYIDGVSITVN